MQTIMITGCSSGFGLETARYFLEQGWKVIATMRVLREDLLPASDRLRLVRLDVTSAQSIAEAIAEVDKNIILLGLANSKMIDAGKQLGLRVANEVFADRAYQADGSLVPRKLPGAVIHNKDEAIARTVRMVTEGKVTAITGEEVEIAAHSICVHGDNPSAVEFVKNIRTQLTARGVEIAPIREIV